jgi:tight adherence protein B
VSRRLWLRLAPALAVIAVLLAAAPVSAGDGNLTLTEAAGGPFPDRAFVITLPKERPLTASQVRVRENGHPVTGVNVVPAQSASATQFGVVLVIDASDSMKGKPIDSALGAAQLFVNHRSAAQQVAVVTFNKEPTVVQPFTTDSQEIVKALAHKPELAYGTHLYDAVDEALSLLHDKGITAGSVVVLSDGADTGSDASASDVIATAKAAHARIFAIGLRSRHFDPKTLKALASATAGDFSEANSVADLSQIYDQLGTRLANEYLLTYRSLLDLGTKVKVSVSVVGVPGTAAAGYAAPSLPPPVFTGYHKGLGGTFWTSGFTMIVFSVFAVGLVAFCVAVLVRPRRRTLQGRLAEFVSLASSSDGGTVTQSLRDPGTEEPDSALRRSKFWQRFSEEVELGGIGMTPSRIAMWTLIATVGLMWLVAVVFSFAGFLVGFLVPLGVWSFVRRRAERTRAQFADQLPDNLAVLSSALRAGHSFVGALSVVVEDAPEPAKSEFARVVAEEQLGRPLDDALDIVVKRMNNADLAQVALVAALQRQTGGSTAEVLDRVVETVRERQDLRRLIKTLTAAGRMSRWVVSALPVVLILAITLLNPGYLSPLFDHTSGRVLIGFAAVLVIGGSLVIKRIVDIKV